MRDIKPHTHKDRTEVIKELTPEIKKALGENLIALGVGGSYARNKDIEYSDIELVAFVKESLKVPWEIRRIKDGLLIVVVADTKEEYIRKYLDVSDVWYASGADKLSPIINEQFIDELNAFVPEDIDKKCLWQIKKRWSSFQEITAKVLNAIKENNGEGLPLIFLQMMKELLIILSYLNKTPYVTLGSYITQSKKFKNKPKGFNKLIDIFVKGEYQDFEAIRSGTKEAFSDLEEKLL